MIWSNGREKLYKGDFKHCGTRTSSNRCGLARAKAIWSVG